MIRICTALIFFAVLGCQNEQRQHLAKGETISMVIVNSLQIPAHKVSVELSADGLLNTELQNRDETPQKNSVHITPSEVEKVRSLIQQIDWDQVSKDEVLGLDGTSVRLEYHGEIYSVWTPSHDTEKRELDEFLLLTDELLRLAQSTASAPPEQKIKTENKSEMATPRKPSD